MSVNNVERVKIERDDACPVCGDFQY